MSEAKAQFLVRDFTEDGLQRTRGRRCGRRRPWAERKYPGAKVAVEIKESYRNMKYVLTSTRRSPTTRRRRSGRAGLTPKRTSIRGGTDGSRLSFMGVPTPNLFDGSMNFHGKKEYVPLEWMDAAVETILHLMDVWVEKSRG